MAKASKRRETNRKDALIEALRSHVRAKGNDYLKDPNITSVGVGLKNGSGPISLQFTVGEKGASALESLDTTEIPATITLADGTVVPTDVIERSYKPAFELVEVEALDERKVRRDPIQPGISISHPKGTAGTIGLIVFDRSSGAPCVLSNWHVLHGNRGAIGDPVVQPGPFDDNNVAGNVAGKLLRSHLGNAGDCALARIEQRGIERPVLELGVTAARMARVALGDKVVKSGRTTGVTYGIVRRIDVIAKIDYRAPTGEQPIGGFEIGVDPARLPADGEISMGGDSGSAWMIASGAKATDIFAGLHFAGESGGSTDEHALACYPLSVQKKLDFVLESATGATKTKKQATGVDLLRSGYNPLFLQVPLPLPELSAAARKDAYLFGGQPLIPYTHFSVCLSKSRRMARYVAWNIDGTRIVRTGRDDFQLDPRIPAARQIGNEAYANNKLDRGHIARRADLVWGEVEEAKQANADSSYYTNIAPQHERYNQSSRRGLWGNLENLILEQVDVQDIRLSVFAGPLFSGDDLLYRGIRLPREYWKLVAYVVGGELRLAAFVLTQEPLLADLEAIDLDPFKLFQVRVADLKARAGIDFRALGGVDAVERPESAIVPKGLEALRVPADLAREVNDLGDLRL